MEWTTGVVLDWTTGVGGAIFFKHAHNNKKNPHRDKLRVGT